MPPQPRYVCIHGHFYQPPRENPWLDAVEVQDSARPYHDWNERVTMECYGPNTAARISTWEGTILEIRNNYRKISFNFGATLLQWLEASRADIYQDILAADRQSVIDRQGHGNAIAQAYNHTILPLATDREKELQVIWGLEDFRARFGRDSEGFWLPECAVDIRTLEVLAANGIKFTILAQRQARRIRALDGTAAGTSRAEWISVDGARIDPTRPYVHLLPSGRSIVIFFYDGPVSQAVAFEGLLHDGNVLAGRVLEGFDDRRDWPQLMHIATDGESYGHHHRYGEMALAYGLHRIEKTPGVALTNYGQYLAMNPPRAEVQIWPNSSWSCVHGIERWRSDCGCNSGGRPGWHQKWRTPLRDAFRFLANRAEQVYADKAPGLFRNPDVALNAYIRVILDQRLDTFREFFRDQAAGPEATERSLEALRLMETMRITQLLFTSCAWFFDDVSGIEVIQNLKYAGRLIQLLQPFYPHIESEFLAMLEKCPSNLGELKNAALCYQKWVKPSFVDLRRVIAHHMITHFDGDSTGLHRLFCYEVEERDAVTSSLGGTRLKLCRVRALSLIDGEALEATAAVLHFGGHDFRCSLTGPLSFEATENLKEHLFSTYEQGSLTDLVRAVDEHFGRAYYGIEHLFSEGRRELLQRVTDDSFHRFDNTIRMIYEENRKLMEYLLEVGAPLPQAFLSAADFVLRRRLLHEMEIFEHTGDALVTMEIAREANRYGLRVTDPVVTLKMEEAFTTAFRRLATFPSGATCALCEAMLDVYELLGLKPDHWEAQNIVFALIHERPLPSHLNAGGSQLPPARGLVRMVPGLQDLALRLKISLEPFERTAPILSPVSSSSERIAMITQ